MVLLEHADRMVDSTHVLRAVVERRLGRTAVPYLWDPAAVAKGIDYVLLRSKTHFRAAYTDITAAIVIIDTPDWGPADLRSLDYVHVPRGEVYPFAR